MKFSVDDDTWARLRESRRRRSSAGTPGSGTDTPEVQQRPRPLERLLRHRQQRKMGEYNSKTTAADEVTWEGYFEGHLICAVSTVRLINGNMTHFCVSSNARIGKNRWNLRGGHS